MADICLVPQVYNAERYVISHVIPIKVRQYSMSLFVILLTKNRPLCSRLLKHPYREERWSYFKYMSHFFPSCINMKGLRIKTDWSILMFKICFNIYRKHIIIPTILQQYLRCLFNAFSPVFCNPKDKYDPSVVFNVCRFKVDIEKYPTIKRLNQALLEIEAFKVSHPSCQPDTPADLRS